MLTLYQFHLLAQGYEASEEEGRYRQMQADVREKARRYKERYGEF